MVIIKLTMMANEIWALLLCISAYGTRLMSMHMGSIGVDSV